jgi:hypothetical protein
MGTAVAYPGVKWPGREVDHSPPSSAEVKMVALYFHSPSWHSAKLFKYKENFYLYNIILITENYGNI